MVFLVRLSGKSWEHILFIRDLNLMPKNLLNKEELITGSVQLTAPLRGEPLQDT